MADQYTVDEPRMGEAPRWGLAISALLVFSLLVGMLVLMPLMGRPGYEVGMYDVSPMREAITVRGERWVVTDQTARLPDVRMIAVGRDDEGHLLYVDSHANYGGGGGGMPETSSDPRSYRELWIRTGVNSYVRVR